jgi:putative membrane protein
MSSERGDSSELGPSASVGDAASYDDVDGNVPGSELQPKDSRNLLVEPQRLHYSSFLFELISHGREFLMPAIFVFLGAASGSWFWGVMALIGFLFSLLRTIVRYLTLRYVVTRGELIVNEGLIFRTQRIVPLPRIQNIDLRQNVLHRLFRVAEVRIETASGAEAEAVLRVLTHSQIGQLRSMIFDEASESKIDYDDDYQRNGGDSLESPEDPLQLALAKSRRGSVSGRELLAIPTYWLLIAGVAGNRGWLVVGVLVGALFQSELFERLLPKQWVNWLQQQRWDWNALLAQWPWIVGLAAALLVLLKLLGAAWFVYRFFGYRLERHGDDLRVSAGLLSSYSTSLPRRRIQFVSIDQPFILRVLGFAILRIETAGGAGGQDQESNLARSWFIPVLPLREVDRILVEIRPDLTRQASDWDWIGPARGTWFRMLRIGIFAMVVITGAVVWGTGFWGLIAAPVVLLISAGFSAKYVESLRVAITPFGVTFRSGILSRKQSFTFFDRIQVLDWNQSPFDRRWGMASISIDTAAAGPAEHRIDMPYLPESHASQLFSNLTYLAAMHRNQQATSPSHSRLQGHSATEAND